MKRTISFTKINKFNYIDKKNAIQYLMVSIECVLHEPITVEAR